MARAVNPKKIPPLPGIAVAWTRSIGHSGMFHARDALGRSVCGRITFDRFRSEDVKNLGDMQWWGVCPHCYSKAIKEGGE